MAWLAGTPTLLASGALAAVFCSEFFSCSLSYLSPARIQASMGSPILTRCLLSTWFLYAYMLRSGLLQMTQESYPPLLTSAIVGIEPSLISGNLEKAVITQAAADDVPASLFSSASSSLKNEATICLADLSVSPPGAGSSLSPLKPSTAQLSSSSSLKNSATFPAAETSSSSLNWAVLRSSPEEVSESSSSGASYSPSSWARS